MDYGFCKKNLFNFIRINTATTHLTVAHELDANILFEIVGFFSFSFLNTFRKIRLDPCPFLNIKQFQNEVLS